MTTKKYQDVLSAPAPEWSGGEMPAVPADGPAPSDVAWQEYTCKRLRTIKNYGQDTLLTWLKEQVAKRNAKKISNQRYLLRPGLLPKTPKKSE